MESVFSGIFANPLIAIFSLLVVVLLLQNLFLFLKVDRLLKGGDGKSLEGTIHNLQTRADTLETRAKAAEAALTNHEGRITRSIQGVSVKRFDPFQNAGGQQSFTTALLNEKGDGVVVAGIHARDGVRVYAKPVSAFKSERELSEEEQGAIEEAKTKLV